MKFYYLVCENNDLELPVACFDNRSDLCSFLSLTPRQLTQALYRARAHETGFLTMGGYITHFIIL